MRHAFGPISCDPGEYEAWYETARGRWIGNTAFRLLTRLLDLEVGRRLLDVSCGTGWFTRRFAAVPGLRVTGLDVDEESLAYARTHDVKGAYLQGDAHSLPFANAGFDLLVSIAALRFMSNCPSALREMIRVTRIRFVIDTPNRPSPLWRQKGQNLGGGAYRGARWHTQSELRSAPAMLPLTGPRFYSGVFLPSGSCFARLTEHSVPNMFWWGALLVVSGTKVQL